MQLPKYRTSVTRSDRDIAVRLETRVWADQREVFDYIAGEGVLPEVLTGYTRFLPAVVATSGRTGPWDVPGSWRIVHLKDGSTAREEVTGYERPSFFACGSRDFTFALRYLATGATGEWRLGTDKGDTTIQWTYTFKARGWLSSHILPLFARMLWAGYMAVCFFNIEKHFAGIGRLEMQVPHSPMVSA